MLKEPWVEEDKFGKVKFAVIQTVRAGSCGAEPAPEQGLGSGLDPGGPQKATTELFLPSCSTVTPLIP